MQDQLTPPTSLAVSPRRTTNRRFSYARNVEDTTDSQKTVRGQQSNCLEVMLTFPNISQERGDVCAIHASTGDELLNTTPEIAQELKRDNSKDNSEDIYVKRHALVHSIYVRVADKSIDWTLEEKFARARYSHFRAAFAQASVVMPLGVVALATNAGISKYWWRVGILIGVVMPVYLLCAYIACRREQHFLKLSGTSGEKMLIGVLCMQTLAIVLAECVRGEELDYGMLAMQIGYLNNFTPMTGFSMQMVSAVFGLFPYCLVQTITFIFPSWNAVFGTGEKTDRHSVGNLAICTPADPKSEAQLVSSMLVPIIIFLYQVLVTYRRDESMRWDSLFKHKLFIKKQLLDSEQRKNEDMLSGMLPKQIVMALEAAQLKPNSENVEPQHFQDVTVIFVEICDFARLCSTVPARDVVEVLNIIYHEFDRLSDLLHVYKVETVAEVYMAVVGAPNPISNHADVAAHFGLALMHSMQLMRGWLDGIIQTSSSKFVHHCDSLPTPLPPPSDPAPLPYLSEGISSNEPSIPGMCPGETSPVATEPCCVKQVTSGSSEDSGVLIRIGLNSGQLFAGVVGMDNPRYKLVGDTVNTASRMESTCSKGRIQISPSTKARLTENMFVLKDRGSIPVKGKGRMNTHYLVGYAGNDTYDTRKISIQKAMQIGHHSSIGSSEPRLSEGLPPQVSAMKSSWSVWNTHDESHSPRERGLSVVRGKDGDVELVRDSFSFNKHDVDENKADPARSLSPRSIERQSNAGHAQFSWLQKVLYVFLLVPASQKQANRISELNADRPFFLKENLKTHLELARHLTIVMPLVLSAMCVFDLLENQALSNLDVTLSYRDVILVRDLGNTFVALVYVFILSLFTLSRRMAQACTIVMLLLQFAALLTVGMSLWETERGIVAAVAMYDAYVLFYIVCTLLQRLAVCATAIATYIVLKATMCDGSNTIEALQNVGFLIVFIVSMSCSLWLQEHLSHVFYFEQRLATIYLNQIKNATNVRERLLTDLLPSHVVSLVRAGISPIAETYDGVTILFTDIKGFTKFSTSISPQKLCHVLNSMYSNFDEIISMWNLHKVEIIGDAYWISAGCPAKPGLQEGADDDNTPPKTTEDLLKERAEFAMRAVEVGLALLRALPSVCDDTSLQMRAGIHTGPVVAGVVGKKGPRYHLFGTTVGYAQSMESSGIPGRVQISDVTHTLLEAGGHAYDYEERTVEVEEADEPPARTWLVNKSNAREAIHIQKKLMEERRRQSTTLESFRVAAPHTS